MKESEPEKTALALGFDPHQDQGPRLLAKGQGKSALDMIALARSLDIPVIENPELSAVLGTLPVGQEAPENLYRALASIFSMVYNLRDETR